jgi:hypothetical protein
VDHQLWLQSAVRTSGLHPGFPDPIRVTPGESGAVRRPGDLAQDPVLCRKRTSRPGRRVQPGHGIDLNGRPTPLILEVWSPDERQKVPLAGPVSVSRRLSPALGAMTQRYHRFALCIRLTVRQEHETTMRASSEGCASLAVSFGSRSHLCVTGSPLVCRNEVGALVVDAHVEVSFRSHVGSLW